jgi:hypothetical protein
MVLCMREQVSASRGPRARIEPTVEALQVALHPLSDGRWVRHRGNRETGATLGRETEACQSPAGIYFLEMIPFSPSQNHARSGLCPEAAPHGGTRLLLSHLCKAPMRAMEAGALRGHAEWRGSGLQRHRKPLAESQGQSGPLNRKSDDHTMLIASN